MADITIGTSTDGNDFTAALKGGIVWTGPLVGYYFFVEVGTTDLVYTKTTDGGSSWGCAQTVDSGAIKVFDVWYDKWTPGNTGTKIHIASLAQQNSVVQYRALDTSDDSVSCAETITQTSTLDINASWITGCISIVVARGGNYYIAEVARNDTVNLYREGFWRSTDSGENWTSRAEVFENTGDANNSDRAILMPGNECDADDVLAIFYDDSNTELSLKTYDNSGDSWAETSISTDVDVTLGDGSQVGYSAVPRHSDNHTVVIASSDNDNACADIHAFDIDDACGITTLTDVFTNNDNHSVDCALFIDQNTDDLYACYIGSTDEDEAPVSSINLYYKKSTDDGSTWGSETQLNEDCPSIHRRIFSGITVGTWGGRFMPCWSEDLTAASPDEHKTNVNNSVAIAGTTNQIARISVSKD